MFVNAKNLSAVAKKHLKEKYGVSPEVIFDVPTEEGRGDLVTTSALSLAKMLKKNPLDIAKSLQEKLKAQEGVEEIEVAGPGYLNVTLTPAALIAGLNSVRQACVPQKARKDLQPVIVEYSQPNIAKPLGIHHIFSTTVGQALANMHRHLGIPTVSINHLGDWGTQFGKLFIAFKQWGAKPIETCSVEEMMALYVRFHEEVERRPALDDEARAAFSALEKGDAAMRLFWEHVVRISMDEIEKLYERLHVRFDRTHGESFYLDKMRPILAEGKQKGVFVPGREGALIVNFPEEKHLPPAIVLKADGSTIYLTRDLATVRYRVDTWHPKEILYVVDVAQQLYFKQLFETVKQLQWDIPHLEHVVFGRMRFADKSMSTRKGTFLRLQDVLDESVKRADALIAEKEAEVTGSERAQLKEMMGVGAVVYGVLSQNRKMDILFDWDKMLSFEGNSAPYVQYTHARARSVLRKAGSVGQESTESIETLSSEERVLMRLLLQFEGMLQEAVSQRLPHRVANYLYELCQSFNVFYNKNPILRAEGALKNLRLQLTSLTAEVLKTGCELLTLRVPERM